MSENKTHIKFTAADIEKYHKGQLSPKEMHDLEKAVLDDPFLADALEGYAITGVNIGADIAELKNRLSEKTGRKKVIPIDKNHNSFPWLRVAAIVIVMVGAGLITYRLAFKNHSKDTALAESKKISDPKSIDSSNASAPLTDEKNNTPAVSPMQQQTTSAKSKKETVTIGSGAIKKDTIVMSYSSSPKSPVSQAPSPAKGILKNESKDLVINDKSDREILSKENKKELDDEKEVTINSYKENNKLNNQTAGNQNVLRNTPSGIINRQADNQYRSNIFRGRVMDAGNNPVPFANITNTEDNVGTYSDAKGYFNLTSPDTVLNVEVRSIGFENNITQLRNNVINNQVVMQDDNQSLSEVVVINNRKPNAAARSRDANRKIEEPEPADGWDNYDTYLVNNLSIPDEIRIKKEKGDVEVSLEVDKNGNPTNIKVEKSLCEKCDEEAIRLIKEGPKWNRRIRKGRAVVTIPFSLPKN